MVIVNLYEYICKSDMADSIELISDSRLEILESSSEIIEDSSFILLSNSSNVSTTLFSI